MEFSRYEVNQQVQRVLVRHGVDLTQLHYSAAGSVVTLYGTLKRDPSGDFSVAKIEAMIKELERLPSHVFLQFELDNWTISREHGNWIIHGKRREITRNMVMEDVDVTEADMLADILRELETK